MKSSGSVFRQNLPTSRLGRPQTLSSRNQSRPKKISSPVKPKQSNPHSHNLGPERPRQGKSDRSSDTKNGEQLFTESWPSAESSPTSSATTSEVTQSSRAWKSSLSTEFGVQRDPVLAKYIERFRHGQPQSREERQLTEQFSEKQHPFWWMSTSSLPLTSKDSDAIQPEKDDRRPAIFSPRTDHQHHRSLSPCRGSPSILSDISQDELDDAEILHLQERAGRLLLRNECTLSDGSAHVSSEGLGCSDFSSPVHGTEPLQTPLPQTIEKATPAQAGSNSAQAQISLDIPSLVPHARPEEDILFQWRLRRKIEQAQSLQQSTLHGPTFSWHPPILSHPSASGQVYKVGQQQQSTQPLELPQNVTQPHIAAPLSGTTEAHTSCPPAANPHPCPPASNPHPFPAFAAAGSSDAQPQAIAHVPAHMHLLCDVLPCPVQSSHSRGQHSLQNIDEFPTKFVHKKTQVPGDLMTLTNMPICEHDPSPSPATQGDAEAQERSCHRGSGRKKKETGQMEDSERMVTVSVKKHKKSRYTAAGEQTDQVTANRISSNHKVSTKVMQKTSQESSSERFSGHYRPPPSPVHSALGQVVSEVLFSTVDPSPAQRIPVASFSPPCSSPTPPPSSRPPVDVQNSMGVISQLLQEAEGSDEEEFEDDPLLQVLRKQRTWVKQQIGEVDSMLNELLDEQHVTSTVARNT